MKGVDYSKTLSKEREYFQDTIRKNQQSTQKRIADNDERTEGILKNQRENFIEDKAELETSYQKNLEQLKEKTASSLDNNTDKFHAEMEKERQAFTQDSINKRKDFDQRLNDITKSYKKAFSSEKDVHEDVQGTTKKKYDKTITDTRTQAEQQLRKNRDEMASQGTSLKDQYNRERQQLVRGHEDHMTDAHKESAEKRSEMREHLRTDFQKSKEVQAAEFDQHKEYSNERLANMQKKLVDRSNDMTRDFSQRNDKLVETQRKDSIKTNQEHQNNILGVHRDYNKQLKLVDLEKKRRDNGSGEIAEVLERQQGLSQSSGNDSRFRDLKQQLADVKSGYENKAISDTEAHNETLRNQSADANALLDRKLNTANAEMINNVSKGREKAEAQVATREHQNRLEKQASDQQINLERNNANERLTKLKETFNSSMKQLEEKHQVSLGDVTKVSNKDKAEYVKKVNAARLNETTEMKREFGRLMDRTVQDYEQRLGNYQRDNEFLKMTMDQKIKNITDQTDKQLESQRTLFEDRRAADLKNSHDQADQREHYWKTALNQNNNNFQKKIDKLQIETDTKLKLLTNDYENKLSELKAMTAKELGQQAATHKVEIDSVKMAADLERRNLISGYENQIDAMKLGHEEQMNSMKDFKRLS